MKFWEAIEVLLVIVIEFLWKPVHQMVLAILVIGAVVFYLHKAM